MSELTTLHHQAALHGLNARFLHFLDANDVDGVMTLFTADACYTHGARTSEGHAAIRQVLEARTKRGPRTTRHIVSGLIIDIIDMHRARGRSVCVLFAGSGPPPVSLGGAQVIADFVDEYILGEDQNWRISRRDIERVFVAPGDAGPLGTMQPG